VDKEIYKEELLRTTSMNEPWPAHLSTISLFGMALLSMAGEMGATVSILKPLKMRS
jgi:hypothetical protein